MSTFRTPVGPQPSRVYWRRRLVLALGLIAVVVIVILIVVRPGSGKPAPTPKATNSASNPASTNPADAAACDPTKITLDANTDATSYDAGVNPVLSFTLKSLMTVPCSINAGSDVQEYRVTSGDELIWTSKDCQQNPVAAPIVLMPGVPKAGPSVPWDRTRSSKDTCTTDREQVIAGGASYHLEVVLGALTSANDRQFLLY